MEGKNLLWKFGFVLLLIAASLLIIKVNGLKKGPDIAGGYSMVFEVDNPKNNPAMIEDVIRVLKRRIDPAGISSLEWRPLRNDRFEIRMPAASYESSMLHREFEAARDELLALNIERADIRLLINTPADQRDAKIKAMTLGQPQRTKAVEQLLVDIAALNKAETALEQARQAAAVKTSSKSRLKELQDNLLAAMKAQKDSIETYSNAWAKVRESNISAAEIINLFHTYDNAMVQKLSDKKQAGMIKFEDRLITLRDEHPARAAQIDKLVDIYKRWAKVKRTLEDPIDLKRMIKKAGVLEFRIAPFKPGHAQATLTAEQVQEFVNILNSKGPEAVIAGGDYVWLPIRQIDEDNTFGGLVTADYAGNKYILLSNRPGDTMLQSRQGQKTWQLSDASPSTDNMGRPIVLFRFDESGAKLFGLLTSSHKPDPSTGREQGDCMAVVLDDEVYSAPHINETITASGQISGNFTLPETRELSNILRAGTLPGKVNPEPVSESGFSASLGKENIAKGIRAAIIGLIAVAAFMLVYYMIGGAIADVALLMNMILVLGAMSLLQAALTMPGIAGLILTIGIAVDANVLIFERLREEQARGLAVRQALRNAYERAFTAIFDSNITTLLICCFLYFVFSYVGMEEIRGFAITLGFGVAFSMFTALVVTRWCFQLLLDAKIIRKPITMLRLVPVTKVNWIGKRYAFWVFSAVVIIIGMCSLVWQGGNIWGIEFSSGTRVLVQLRDDALIDGKLPQDEIVRGRFSEVANGYLSGGDNQMKIDIGKLTGSARVEVKLNEELVPTFVENYGEEVNGRKAVTAASWKKQGMDEKFFQALDRNSDGKLEADELKAIPQTAYQISTTSANVPLIRKVINEAFGEALKHRVPCKYTIEKGGVVEQLGVKLAQSGATPITKELASQSRPGVRDEFMDFEGGLLFVVKGVTPAITVSDLSGRIADVRNQPDFEAQAATTTKVVGLTGNGETYDSFAILVLPEEAIDLTNQNVLDEFTNGEQTVVVTALEREDPTVITSFDASIAGYTVQLAIVAVVLSWITIIVYLWLRFGSVRWGVAAVICLVHDVLIVVGLVAFTGWLAGTGVGNFLMIGAFKVDLAIVTAVLTIIGYSVNDTIVVFDRIRENRGKLREVTAECINNSINQTLPRTLLTSFTTFLVVLIMYIWGGDGMRAFSYALLVGIVFGTYSSIAIASPLLLGFKYALVVKVTTEDGEAVNVE